MWASEQALVNQALRSWPQAASILDAYDPLDRGSLRTAIGQRLCARWTALDGWMSRTALSVYGPTVGHDQEAGARPIKPTGFPDP